MPTNPNMTLTGPAVQTMAIAWAYYQNNLPDELTKAELAARQVAFYHGAASLFSLLAEAGDTEAVDKAAEEIRRFLGIPIPSEEEEATP